MTYRILLFSLVITAFSACFKARDHEPFDDIHPLTTEGKNTFGCYIDGVPTVFGNTFPNFGSSNLTAKWHTNHILGDSLLYIWARKSYDIYPVDPDLHLQTEEIGIPIIAKDTGYALILHEYGDFFTRIFVDHKNFPRCIYKIDSTKEHHVRLVRFDPHARIASGSFAMTLYNATTCNDTVNITNGRFDVKFLIQ